jgi:methylated-DNA-[protein]-cysteine S-methyltransferase
LGHFPPAEEKLKSFPDLERGLFKTIHGWCAAAWTPKGLSVLVLPQKTQEKALRALDSYLPPLPLEIAERPLANVPDRVQKETHKALTGRKFAPLSFDLFFMTGFQQKVLNATTRIPWGQVRTYGWVARQAGSPRGFRAAGQALNKNPVCLLIPCHRVIAGGNKLGGYGGGLDWKIKLLKSEEIQLQRLSDGSYKVSLL